MSRSKAGSNTTSSTYMHYSHTTVICEKCDGYGWVESKQGQRIVCDLEHGCGGIGNVGDSGTKVTTGLGSESAVRAKANRARKAEIGEAAFKAEVKAKKSERMRQMYAAAARRREALRG